MTKFFLFYLYCFAIFSSTVWADDDDLKPTAKTSAAQNLIFLDKPAQAIAGLKTILLKSVNYRPETISYGTAISVEPLLTIQNQYLNAIAQQNSAAASANFSQNNLNRLTYLHREEIISSHALQNQQATLQADKATLDSSHYLRQQIINNSQLTWGAKLTHWMLNVSSGFVDLIQQRTTLLKITFPSDNGITAPPKTIFVAPSGHREQAIAAEFISAVPQTDSFSQALQYFYHVSAKQIKTGMRVSAWIPVQQQAQTGVIIPESALVWHLGQALVFVKMTEQHFSHRPVSAYRKVAGGYWIGNGLKAGEHIVSTGAQMLLSQEFKGQIPNEDDD